MAEKKVYLKKKIFLNEEDASLILKALKSQFQYSEAYEDELVEFPYYMRDNAESLFHKLMLLGWKELPPPSRNEINKMIGLKEEFWEK